MEKMSINIAKYLIVSIILFTFTFESQAKVAFLCHSVCTIPGIEECNGVQDSVPKESKKKKEKVPKAKRSNKNRVSFETFDYNYERAQKFYQNSQYLSAAKILEELYPLSLGTTKADTILFMFADCYYQNKDYEMAAFHYKDYVRRYPRSERAELAYVMSVKAVYNISPYFALDQSETIYAIEELNMFIARYPNSKYMDECNEMLDVLRNKLAKKDFEIVKLYFETENYKATQIAVTNFLKTYSYSNYAAEAAYILVKNNFQYAKKSVEKKKVERFRDCLDAYQSFRNNFPDSQWLTEAVKYADEATKQIEKKQKSRTNI